MRINSICFNIVLVLGLLILPCITQSQPGPPKHGTKSSAKMDQANQSLMNFLAENNKDLNKLLYDAAKDLQQALSDIAGAKDTGESNPLAELQKAISGGAADSSDHQTGEIDVTAQAYSSGVSGHPRKALCSAVNTSRPCFLRVER